MANIKKIKLPNGTEYDIKDSGALPLTGGTVTGPVIFEDSTSMDEATIGDLVVNGNGSFTNNIQANTINGVTVGTTPKFTDTVTTATTTGSGNAVTAITASNGALTVTKGTTFLTSHQDISGKADKATTLAGYGITDAKISSGTITLGSNTITPLTSSSTLSAAKLSGAIPSAVTATTQASTDNSTKIATTAYVTTAIANLPEPMLFKGSVGTGGTVTSLPTAAAANEGWTYKVITALSSPAAKVGDTVISNGSNWVVIPSGDEPSGTVTSVGISNGGGLSVSGSPITSSGTITISHADTSSQASSSNSGRTYIQSITLDTYGHVTGISTASETVTNTDEKLKVAEVTSATQYYPLVGTGTTAVNRQYDTTGFKYKGTTGTTSAVGSAILELGNSTASGTAGNKQAQLIMYGTNAKKATITLAAPSADIALALPTSGGTIALTSQIPTVPSVTGSNTTGISIAAHGTTSITGVQSTTTTASKASGANGSAPTLGTAISLIGVQSSTTTASKVTVGSHSTDYGVKSAGSGSFTSGSFSGGSGSFTASVTDHTLSFSHTHTAATHGADSHTHTAPTLGSKVPTVSASDITVPIKNTSATSIPNVTSAGSASTWSFTDVTVPIKNTSATTVVTGTGHTITDNGHTHTI